jgi:hypothetical protein
MWIAGKVLKAQSARFEAAHLSLVVFQEDSLAILLVKISYAIARSTFVAGNGAIFVTVQVGLECL